jgi:hypothetical protein
MIRRPALLILAAAAAIGTAACASGAGGGVARNSVASGGAGRGSALAPAAAPTSAPEAGGVAAPSQSLSVPASPGPSGGAADIVVGSPAPGVSYSVTAAYVVPHGQFLASFETVVAAGVGLGGYVVSSNTSPDSSGRIVSGEVTMAVPTARMASLLNGIPKEWTASSIDFGSVDHGADIVDVQARLTSAQAHLTALQNLLARATSLSDITTLEQQIEAVETAIDTDKGQLSSLQQSVAYATATIELREEGARVVAAPAPNGPSLGGGIRTGWENALMVLSFVLEGLVTALPIAVVLLAGWLVWRRLRSRGGTSGVGVPS